MAFSIELSFNNYSDSFIVPVNPEEISIRENGNSKTYTVAGLGEINVIKAPKLSEINFSSIFPSQRYPFVSVKESDRLNPDKYLEKIKVWRESKKPIRFHAVSSTYVIDMPVSIESFEWKEVGGSPGDIEYQISLKKYVFYAAKKVKVQQVAAVDTQTNEPALEVETEEPDRPDDRPIPATYALGPDEGLWVVAQRVFGDGSRYKEIQEFNNLTDAEMMSLPEGYEVQIPGGEAVA